MARKKTETYKQMENRAFDAHDTFLKEECTAKEYDYANVGWSQDSGNKYYSIATKVYGKNARVVSTSCVIGGEPRHDIEDY